METVPDATAASPLRLDFSFALGQPRLADCTLRVHVDLGNRAKKRRCLRGSTAPYGNPAVREFKASALILSANSSFFKAILLQDNYEEGAKQKIDIDLEPGGEEVFKHLITFFYTGALAEAVTGSLDKMLKLLALADQFQAEPCFSFCLGTVQSFLRNLTTYHALQILSMPKRLKSHPELQEARERARKAVVKAYGALAIKSTDHELRRLPQVAVVEILESREVAVPSEDVLFKFAYAWARATTPTPAAMSQVLCNVLLPRIRVSALSPKWLEVLISWLQGDELQHNGTGGGRKEEGRSRVMAKEEPRKALGLGLFLASPIERTLPSGQQVIEL